MQFIFDLGSNHGNNIEILKDTAKFLSSFNNVSLKLQLFPKDNSKNIYLDRNLFRTFVHYCKEEYPQLPVFASVWDKEGYELLQDLSIPQVKFAWSQRNNHLIETACNDFEQVFVSYDFLDDIHSGVIPLLCDHQYPVLYKIDFCPEMFVRFQGFSDHSLGVSQSLNVLKIQGVKFLEKHIHGDEFVDCPDRMFSIGKEDISKLL